MYRFFANNLLLHPTNTSNSSKIEWAYSFDVHTNGYFPIILLLYLTQIFLWPLLIRHEWICLFFGNTLYLVAVGTVIIKIGKFSLIIPLKFLHYLHIVYLGYAALPFVIRSELILCFAPVILILYIISLIGLNIPKSVISWYFSLQL